MEDARRHRQEMALFIRTKKKEEHMWAFRHRKGITASVPLGVSNAGSKAKFCDLYRLGKQVRYIVEDSLLGCTPA